MAGRKTSVYLAQDVLAALEADPRTLAQVIRDGLGLVGHGRTRADVARLREHGGEIILAKPGPRQPEPDLGNRTIRWRTLEEVARATAAGVTADAYEALQRHGYPADLHPRGMTGSDPGQVIDGWEALLPAKLRNWVCYLDGTEVDGHDVYDDDPFGPCRHCDAPAGGDDGE